MTRNLFKGMAAIAVITGAVALNAAGAFAASTSWNFSDSAFNGLGTLSSTVTVNNLKLIATSSKTMKVSSSSATVSNVTYKYCLALGVAVQLLIVLLMFL